MSLGLISCCILHQLSSIIDGTIFAYMLLHPYSKIGEVAGGKFLVKIRVISSHGRFQLSCIHRIQRISWEVARVSSCLMNVLKYALLVIGYIQS